MNIRVKKLPIVLPLLLVAALLVSAAVMSRMGRTSAAAHTDLGQKYLNDMNYTGAVAEFLQSISLDPTAQEARLGLAQAYIASGSPEMVSGILEPLTEAGTPEAYRLLIESQRAADPVQALITAQKLVERTDSDEDYALRDALLSEALARPHSYAQGYDQQLALSGGEVRSSGSNTLGQLGTGQSIGTDQIQPALQSAQFPGTPQRVYCAGRTSYVIDSGHNLWAAGENRWGQLGVSYVTTHPQEGWTQILDTGDAAAAAGSVGTLYVLKTDGSLWYAGQGGVMDLRRINGLGPVAAIDSNNWQTAILTAQGALYLSDEDDPLHWTRIARDVKHFCFSDTELLWVTTENQICSQYGLPQLPDTWLWDGQGVTPDFTITAIAAAPDALLLRDASNTLHRIHNGTHQTTENLPTTSIYTTNGTVILELPNGTAQRWDLTRQTPENL